MSIYTDFGPVVKYYDLGFGTGFEPRNIDSCFGDVMLSSCNLEQKLCSDLSTSAVPFEFLDERPTDPTLRDVATAALGWRCGCAGGCGRRGRCVWGLAAA